MTIVLAISVMGLMRLRFETGILEVLPKHLPSVEALRVSQEHFDNDQQVALLLESPDEEIFEEDVAELAAVLEENLAPAKVVYRSEIEEDPDAFGDALAEIWRYAPPEDVAILEKRLLDEDSLKARLEEVKDQIRQSFDQEKSTMAAYDPAGFLRHPAILQLIESGLSFQSEDGKSHLLLIQNPYPTTDYNKHAAWLQQIRNATDSWDGLNQLDLRYGLTGGPVYNAEIGAGMEKDMSGTITLTSILVAILFLIVQRHPGQMAMISLLLALSFLITLGIGGWVFGTLNLVSVGFAAILLGLVIDYAVVIARESISGFTTAAALRKELAPGILWAALSTAIVFGLLSLSTFNGVRQLGGLIVIGLASGASVMLIFTPMFLGKFPTKPARFLLTAPFLGGIFARGVIASGVLIAAAVFIVKGEPDVSFSFSMVQPTTSEAAATFEKIQEKFPAWSDKNLQIIARGDSWEQLRSAARDTEKQLAALKEKGVIARYQWPVDFIPSEGNRQANSATLAKLAEAKENIVATIGANGFSEKGTALDGMVLEAFGKLSEPGEIAELAKHSLGVSDTGERFLSGSLLVKEAVTEDNVSQLATLSAEKFQVTSWAVIQADLLPSVRRDFRVIFIPATAALLLTLVIVFRSVRDAAVSIAVLLTSLALVNAFVVATGHTWNFLSGMAIPLIVGTGIDYSIHLIFSLRRNDGDFNEVWNGVGKAICFCGLSTAIGFGSLLFASNEMLRSMGMLCSFGVLLTTALSVFVIPGLWQRSRR